jgi:hypothetical protein
MTMTVHMTNGQVTTNNVATTLVARPTDLSNGRLLIICQVVQSGDDVAAPADAFNASPIFDIGWASFTIHWGIVGTDIPLQSTYSFTGSSGARLFHAFSVSGVVDDTIDLLFAHNTFSTPSLSQFPSPSLDVTAAGNRTRAYFNFGCMVRLEQDWGGYSGGDFPALEENVQYDTGASNSSVTYGVTYLEDNSAQKNTVQGGNFFPTGGSGQTGEFDTLTVALVGPILKQTDIIAPALVF